MGGFNNICLRSYFKVFEKLVAEYVWVFVKSSPKNKYLSLKISHQKLGLNWPNGLGEITVLSLSMNRVGIYGPVYCLCCYVLISL